MATKARKAPATRENINKTLFLIAMSTSQPKKPMINATKQTNHNNNARQNVRRSVDKIEGAVIYMANITIGIIIRESSGVRGIPLITNLLICYDMSIAQIYRITLRACRIRDTIECIRRTNHISVSNIHYLYLNKLTTHEITTRATKGYKNNPQMSTTV